MLHFIARRRRCLIAGSPAQGRGELDEVAGIRIAFCIYLASCGAERGVLAVLVVLVVASTRLSRLVSG